MAAHATFASITSADFANDGWFNTPSLQDIHPALREAPTIIGTTGEPDIDDQLAHAIFAMADLNIEGGGDKIVMPIFHNGADLTHIYSQPWESKPARYYTHPKYTVFPAIPETGSGGASPPPHVSPLKLRRRAQSRSTERREAAFRPHQHKTHQDETYILSFPSPPPAAPLPPPPQDAPDSPTDPYFSPSLDSSIPSISSPVAPPPMTPPPKSALRRLSQYSGSDRSSSSDQSVPPLSSWSADSSISQPSELQSPDPRPSVFRLRKPSASTTTSNNPATDPLTDRKPSLVSPAPLRLRLRNILKGAAPSALIDCAKSGDYSETLRLLAPGSNQAAPALDATDRGGFTALHWACKMGHTSIARALIARHANLTPRTKAQDRTPLFFASAGGFTDIVASLLSAGAPVDAASSMDGATALHTAAQHGHELVVDQLIDAGANVNQRDVEGLPPLMWATQGRQLGTVRVLAARGARLDTRIRLGANLELAPREGLTPLHRAVQSGNHALARLFVELGADVDADGPNGLRPLHRAAMKGDLAMAALLLEGGAGLVTVTEEGWAPLHVAARQGHGLMCKLLVKSGAEEGLLTNKGETARDLARGKGWADLF